MCTNLHCWLHQYICICTLNRKLNILFAISYVTGRYSLSGLSCARSIARNATKWRQELTN